MILTMSCASIPKWESDTDRPNSEEKRKKHAKWEVNKHHGKNMNMTLII